MNEHEQRPGVTARGAGRAYAANRDPIGFETDLGSLPVSGEFPAGLRGTLMRIGPNARDPAAGARWLAGDGMLHQFMIDGGEVRYRNRWIRGVPAAAPRAGIAANANLLLHAGRLLAFGDMQPPVRLAGAAMAQAQAADLGPATAGRWVAHPKIDPMSGEMLFFGAGSCRGGNSTLLYGAVDAAGRMRRLDRFEAPAGLAHDFAMTERNLLLPLMTWAPQPRVQVGILARDGGPSGMRWTSVPRCCVHHTMNAWDDADRLCVDLMQSTVSGDSARPAFIGSGDDPRPRLCRWTVALQSDPPRLSREWLCDVAGEFPRIDERYAGAAHRHGWFVGDGADGSPFARLMHLDHHDGRLDGWALPPGGCASEAVFVPRRPDAAEGDGWLLTVAFRGDTGRSDLLLFDALNVCHGPLAAAHLPHRVPNGLHGTWVDADAVIRAS